MNTSASTVAEVVAWLNARLNLAGFSADHSNNGLQVEGGAAVTRVAAGVDACAALFEEAHRRGADLVLAHHGLSWGSEPRRLTGFVATRYGALFRNRMSLYACHLPLDAHPECGNNAELARLIRLNGRTPFFRYDGVEIGFRGVLDEALTPEALAAVYREKLPSSPRIFAAEPTRPVRRIGIVSGGGGLDGVIAAAECGCELFVTGEMEHVMYHAARELGVGILALGHYASETVGVKALLAEVTEQFSLPGMFIELPTGL